MRKKNRKNVLLKVFDVLYAEYGSQGWWPLMDAAGDSGSVPAYHPHDFDYPRTKEQRFEIAIGAILTQNTSWENVQKALINLHEQNSLYPKELQSLASEELEELIRPSGYYRQKAKKIREYCRLSHSLGTELPNREQLLSVWGIGPETADSILLYGWKQPIFVVDAYTKRILSHLGMVSETASYHEIQLLFHDALPADWILFQEYHALLVRHAKYFYSRKPWGRLIDTAGNESLCRLKEIL